MKKIVQVCLFTCIYTVKIFHDKLLFIVGGKILLAAFAC
jgi:hypothetical protein